MKHTKWAKFYTVKFNLSPWRCHFSLLEVATLYAYAPPKNSQSDQSVSPRSYLTPWSALENFQSSMFFLYLLKLLCSAKKLKQ